MQFILLGVTLLILIVNVLVGLSRGFSRGLLRLITLLVAVVAAFFLAKGLSASLADKLMPLLEEALASNESINEFISTQPNAMEALAALAKMLVTPILFLLCYVALKIVTWIIYLILRAVFSVGKPKNLLVRRLGGLGMGLLAGLIGLLVFVTPVMGYTDILSRTVSEVDMISENESTATLVEYNASYIAPAAETPVASQIYKGIGSKIFKGLTTVEWDGEKADLETEWFAVLSVIDKAGELKGKSFVDYGTAESQVVHDMVDGVGGSKILSDIGSGVLNGVSNAWLQGNTFLGIAMPKLGDENADVIIFGVLRVFSTTSDETLVDDLDAFADVFDLLIKYDMMDLLAGGNADGEFAAHLVESGFLEEARALLASRERLKPVTVALADVGMRMLVAQLGLPEDYRETCGELMDDMSAVLKGAVNESGQIDTAVLADNLEVTLADHGVEIPAEATEIIAQGLTDEFTAEELTTLSGEEITDRLIERFGQLDNIEDLIPQQ